MNWSFLTFDRIDHYFMGRRDGRGGVGGGGGLVILFSKLTLDILKQNNLNNEIIDHKNNQDHRSVIINYIFL